MGNRLLWPGPPSTYIDENGQTVSNNLIPGEHAFLLRDTPIGRIWVPVHYSKMTEAELRDSFPDTWGRSQGVKLDG